ncbi:NB-ARC domain containing protein [Aphelenchoides bicaudatus]|nr:NB-ARC domain containing protein [Aphelenchoides bicaudatus]
MENGLSIKARVFVVTGTSSQITQTSNKKNENFCVLVDGIAGSGKTNLVCDLLWSRSDICGHYFKKIVWLTDRNLDSKQVASLGLDALLLLPNGLPHEIMTFSNQTDSPPHEQLRSFRLQTIRIMLSKCLAENPQTLLIIDDVYLQETCSIIATSTRPEIFAHIDRCQSFHLGSDDVYDEDIRALCSNYDIDSIGEHSAREIIRLTGGNFALMEKLLYSSQTDTRRLQTLLDQLQFGNLDMLKCTSYYQYSSLNTCFEMTTKILDNRFAYDLPTLAVLQPSAWIDIEVVSLVWPIDMPGSGQTSIAHLVSKDMNTLASNSLLEHRTERKSFEQADQLRIDPIFHYYLLSTAEQQVLINTLTFFKRDLQKQSNINTETERSFKKYWIDNEKNLQQLETVLKQPKRRVGTAEHDKSTSWFSNWLAYFWSK